jgi:hypothetical protein
MINLIYNDIMCVFQLTNEISTGGPVISADEEFKKISQYMHDSFLRPTFNLPRPTPTRYAALHDL